MKNRTGIFLIASVILLAGALIGVCVYRLSNDAPIAGSKSKECAKEKKLTKQDICDCHKQCWEKRWKGVNSKYKPKKPTTCEEYKKYFFVPPGRGLPMGKNPTRDCLSRCTLFATVNWECASPLL